MRHLFQTNLYFVTTLLAFLFIPSKSFSQFGAGLTSNFDFYQRYTNPEDNLDLGRSSGSAILNFSIGPKIWFGGPAFSFSIESQIGLGVLGLDTKNYKGLGIANIPIIGQLNFRGTSSLGSDQKTGFSVGGGIQYNRTELFGVNGKYKDLGLTRTLFPTYIIQAGYGFGISGFVISGYVRYGFHPDTKANSLNIGLQTDLNILGFGKNFRNPNSSL